jgi:hypothetical protein
VTARDRIILTVVAFAAAAAGFWYLALQPKRDDASALDAKITSVQQRLDTALAGAAQAEAAKRRYVADYAAVARLGKAVPVEDDVPSLVYQLESVAHDNKVDFRKIALNAGAAGSTTAASQAAAVASASGKTPTSGGSSGSGTTATAATATASAAALPPGATVGSAGFPTMPFSFDFQGKFFNMQRFLRSLSGLTAVQGKTIKVKGRLLTVDGFTLKAGPKGFPDIDATVLATAYLLPADEGLTTGATPSGPASAGATTVASTSPGPATGTTSSLHGSN